MIVPLDSAAARDAARVGGKASTLARLRAAGFPVPDGFVVTADDDAGAALVEGLRDLEARIGAGARLAVRSSGRAEDSVAASFAGQYETVLGVCGADELSSAIARCFASFSSARARAYQQGVGVTDTGGAVLVQQLVAADAAGVAFTIDPLSGARDRIVIDAGAGLGDAVVGGRVTPDGFVVLKATGEIVERRVAGSAPCIDDAAVRAVAALARRVEDQHEAPVDIEWAWQGGHVHLLQARPVTATAASWMPGLNTRIDPRFPLYSNGNVSEILPGCVTPFTYSMFARNVERAFRSVIESLGSMPDVGPDPIVVGFFFHRVYLNVSYFMTAADNSPGASRDTVYEDLIGPPPQRHPAFSPGDLLPWRLWRGLRIVGRFFALQGRLPKDVAACRTQFDDLRAGVGSRHPSEWTAGELASWIEMNDASMEPAIVHIRASQCATSSFTALRAFAKTSLGDETGALASSLVTGIGSVGETNPAFGIFEIARVVAGDPSLLRMFEDGIDDDRLLARLNAATGDAPAHLREELDRFVERFGHRGFREAELRSPVWRERPATILAHVRRHLDPGGVAPDVIAARQRTISRDARAAALARLPAFKRGWFNMLLTSARAHIAAREEMKDLLLRFLDLTRRVVAEAKPRLGGVLDDPDDIYFLLDSEVAAALRGGLSRATIADIVRTRRRDFERCAGVDVPKIQDGAARWIPRRAVRSAADGLEAGDLSGLPVSPGIAEGRARVILDPDHAALEPGEILVAPVTDVAWTPLFLRAAGLVVEVGGPLSHGSIVAREYGLPAVTAVAGATTRIRTGDCVRVDANRGVVTILPGQ